MNNGDRPVGNLGRKTDRIKCPPTLPLRMRPTMTVFSVEFSWERDSLPERARAAAYELRAARGTPLLFIGLMGDAATVSDERRLRRPGRLLPWESERGREGRTSLAERRASGTSSAVGVVSTWSEKGSAPESLACDARGVVGEDETATS